MKNKFSIKKNGYVKRVRNADRMGLGDDSGEFKVNFGRDCEIIPAEIIPAEIIPAEIIPAEIIPAEIIPAEIIPAGFLERVTPPHP